MMHPSVPPLPSVPWPPEDDDIRLALLAAYADGSWGRYDGPNNERLVTELCQLLDIEYAYPCCSGTFAVELALRMLKIGPGDEVVLAGYDFAGNFRAIEATGARPVLVDIVPGRWHLDVEQLADAVSTSTKAVIVSHLHGALASMREVMALAQRHGWLVVEDACQATGAIVDGRPTGTWGHVGTLSFGGSKLLTAGRGGAVVTRDAVLLQRAKVFCEQGNNAFPLSELQAAVLLPQLARLKQRNEQRIRAVETIRACFHDMATDSIRRMLKPVEAMLPDDSPAYYKVGWLIDLVDEGPEFARTQLVRESLAKSLQAQGVAVDAGFRGFARRSASRCRMTGDLPYSRQAAAGTLVLHHPILLADSPTLERLATVIAETANNVLKTEPT